MPSVSILTCLPLATTYRFLLMLREVLGIYLIVGWLFPGAGASVSVAVEVCLPGFAVDGLPRRHAVERARIGPAQIVLAWPWPLSRALLARCLQAEATTVFYEFSSSEKVAEPALLFPLPCRFLTSRPCYSTFIFTILSRLFYYPLYPVLAPKLLKPLPSTPKSSYLISVHVFYCIRCSWHPTTVLIVVR